MKKKPKITKETTISEVIKKHPKSVFIFMDWGLHCIGCPLAQNDTVEGAAKIHHLDLEKLLKDLNKTAKKTGKKL